jgi:hypothetical protein
LLVDQDDYVAEFAGDALRTILGVLSRFHPGKIIEFVVNRDTEVCSMSVTFYLDARPGVAESAVSVLFGSIMEGIVKAPSAVDGIVDLNR